MTSEPSPQDIRETLQSVKTIAVVGASDKENRASNGVMRFLQSKGYRCIPVNPRLAGSKLLGETVYATLSDIPEDVDMADMFVNSDLVGLATDQAIDIGARVVWMQLGVIDKEAAQRARDAGLTVVMNRCPAIEWARVGLP